MKDLHIVAIVYAKEGQEEQLRQDLIALAAPSQKEDGNLRYEVLVDQEDPRRFVFVEHWSDKALQEKHHTEGKHILHFHGDGARNIERAEVFRLDRIA